MSNITLINSRSRKEYIEECDRIKDRFNKLKKNLEEGGQQLLFLKDNVRAYSLYESNHGLQAFCIGDDLRTVIPKIQDFRRKISTQADEFLKARMELIKQIDAYLKCLDIIKHAYSDENEFEVQIKRYITMAASIATVLPALVIMFSDVIERQNLAISLASSSGDLKSMLERGERLIRLADEQGVQIWSEFLEKFPPNIDLTQVQIQY